MNDLRERYDFLFDGSGDLTQETMLLYVFGPLENGARQAVEQHLGECEMCRDAAEGIALLGTKEQALAALAVADTKLLERLEALKQKVTRDGKEALITKTATNEQVKLKTEKPQRRIGWYRYAAAASVILVVGIAFWVFNQNMTSQSDGISMKEEDSLGLFKEGEFKKERKRPIEEPSPVGNTNGSSAINEDNENPDGTVTVTTNGGTGTYTYQWDDKTSSDEISAKEATKPGTYTVTDANGNSQSEVTASKQAPAAPKPAAPAPAIEQNDDVADLVVFDEEVQEDPILVGEVTADGTLARNDKQKDLITAPDTLAFRSSDVNYNYSTGIASGAAAPAPSIDKGTSNSNFTLNNAANMTLTDASVNQAQYPGGMAEVQKYFDKAVYPTGTKKGYKGVIIMELSFDEKGKITKSTIIQGLGNPYDIVILDLAKKMPNWEAPAPYGEPFASTRLVTVEVTVR